jgi:Domain of unknown function (DUF4406)
MSEIKLLYVASPYRAKTKELRDLHVESARHLGTLAARLGWFPVMPTVNTHRLGDLVPDAPEKLWLEGTAQLLRRCDAVLFGPGWENSEGCKGELVIAKEMGLDVFYETRELPNLVS